MGLETCALVLFFFTVDFLMRRRRSQLGGLLQELRGVEVDGSGGGGGSGGRDGGGISDKWPT